MQVIHIETLEAVHGGAGQAQLRQLARTWCPRVYEKNASQPTLTRRMGEQCLDEAGYGQYKSMLDQYFPK
jgi:hypothetical protein